MPNIKDEQIEERPETTLKDGSKYTGQWKGSKREGYGTLILKNGATYEGQWSDDKRNGQGTFRDSNGDLYVGEWK